MFERVGRERVLTDEEGRDSTREDTTGLGGTYSPHVGSAAGASARTVPGPVGVGVSAPPFDCPVSMTVPTIAAAGTAVTLAMSVIPRRNGNSSNQPHERRSMPTGLHCAASIRPPTESSVARHGPTRARSTTPRNGRA